MDRIITASEANQRFSEMLRQVQAGESFTVTSHGRPVARVGPVGVEEKPSTEEQHRRREKAERLLAYMATLPRRTVEPWTREELYER